MSGKSERSTVVAIVSYCPIGKAEAADCIIPDKEREREAMMMMIMIEDKRRFSSVND